MTTDAALLSLLRLVSPALPVGGFAYSQGLEYAVDAGWVTDADQVRDWLGGVLAQGLARLDVPLLMRLHGAEGDDALFGHWNDVALACRETRELRLEDQQMGRALWRLLGSMNEPLPAIATPSWPAAFALAARRWGVAADACCQGYLWSWLENQLAVAAKTVPIGQTDSQRIAAALLPAILDAVITGSALPDDEIGAGLPGLALASMLHETQYSRLFRS
ncbi:MAG: urease accessory protein UreF [Porticoccaceae bacterium]|jgi:urease accessory protein|nr:urease accessory protein UreF [Porticoccaceae bacterium]MEA3299599.1 urease accessory protein UreF [Pseudomonadota bacterium]HLS97489.1 urease accessory protein UreF [Porticoccaceae bacterium]